MKKFFLALSSILVLLTLFVVTVRQININSSKRTLASVTDIVAAEPLGIDFTNQIATGSPLVFGGVQVPYLAHQDAWNLIAGAGVTMIRRAIALEDELPRNITVDDYRNNKNNVQSTSVWNNTKISETNTAYTNLRQRGIKVMAIFAYSPAWLTYSGTVFGVPKDWGVYEDIVKKSYRLHRPYLDMIEVWNEPDLSMFLNLTGSGLTRKEAYAQIFEHSVNAILSVNAETRDGRKIPILAPSGSNPTNTEIIDFLLTKPVSKYVDGVSVHSYGVDEPSWTRYLTVMKKYGKGSLPIYVTEWNKTSSYIRGNEYVSGNIAIPYTGKKLVQFLKYGAAGANYFSTTLHDPLSTSMYVNSFGFYKRTNNVSTLLPQGRTWQLLSRSVGLGYGASRVYKTYQPILIEAMGFTNSKSEPGLAIVNGNTTGLTVRVSLQNLRLPKGTTAKVYIASGTYDAKAPYCTQDSLTDLSNPSFMVTAPAQSVVGITFTRPRIAIINTIMRVLAISTTRNCLIGY